MFKDDWLRAIVRGSLAVISVFLVLQGGFLAWQQYELSRNAHEEQRQAADDEAKKAADKITSKCQVIAQFDPAFRECLENEIQAYQKQDTADKDLQAQQGMAVWAFITAAVSAASLLVGIGGLIGLFRSLYHTQTAISNDREIGEAQVRAYVHVGIVSQKINAGVAPVVVLEIVNTGQSPAKNVRHVAILEALEHPLPDAQGDLITVNSESKEPKQSLSSTVPLKVEVKSESIWSKEELDLLIEGKDKRLYVGMIVFYDDVFGKKPRKTKFCASLTPSAKGPVGKVKYVNTTTGRTSYSIVTELGWEISHVHNEAT